MRSKTGGGNGLGTRLSFWYPEHRLASSHTISQTYKMVLEREWDEGKTLIGPFSHRPRKWCQYKSSSPVHLLLLEKRKMESKLLMFIFWKAFKLPVCCACLYRFREINPSVLSYSIYCHLCIDFPIIDITIQNLCCKAVVSTLYVGMHKVNRAQINKCVPPVFSMKHCNGLLYSSCILLGYCLLVVLR